MTIPIKNSRSQWKVLDIIEKPICVCVCLPAGRISGHGGGSPRRNSARTVAFSLQQHTTHKWCLWFRQQLVRVCLSRDSVTLSTCF